MHRAFTIALVSASIVSSWAFAESKPDVLSAPDRKAKIRRDFPNVQFDIDPLTPMNGKIATLETVDPGLAAALVLYSTTAFKSESVKPPKESPTPSTISTLTVGEAGATTVTTTTTNKQEAADSTSAPTSGTSCKVSGLRKIHSEQPDTVAQAFVDIDSNSEDECYHEHVVELAKAFVSRSNALCSIYVANIDGTQRTYKTAFSVASTIFGAVGAFLSPAKVFSALSGMSSGISGNLDSGVFYGEAGYLLATAIKSSQAEDQAALYARLGIATASGGAAGNPTAAGSAGGANGSTVITVTYKPATPGKRGKPAAHGKPAIPEVVAIPAATVVTIGGPAAKTNTPAKSGGPPDADLKLASIGTIYTEINSYHNGCSVRVGLNQLQNKLNSSTPVKAPAAAAKPAAPSGS